MPASSYRITEPHPTVSNSQYLYAGRGGAGNYAHVDPKTLTTGADASGPASRTALKASQQPYYASGRGGAGNMTYSSGSERPMFSFDEELERQRRMMQHQTPIYHVGRGGAGNYASEKTRTGSMSSADSLASEKPRKSIEGVFGRIRGSFASGSTK